MTSSIEDDAEIVISNMDAIISQVVVKLHFLVLNHEIFVGLYLCNKTVHSILERVTHCLIKLAHQKVLDIFKKEIAEFVKHSRNISTL